MLQMQTYIIIAVLIFSIGAVSAGFEKLSKLAEFIADIYHKFPRGCIFILYSEAQQQGENEFCVISLNVVILMKINVLTVTWER